MVRQLLQVSTFKVNVYSDFETWDEEEGKLVKKKMHDVYCCDGCGKQMFDVLENIAQIIMSKCVIFVCGDCRNVLRK